MGLFSFFKKSKVKAFGNENKVTETKSEKVLSSLELETILPSLTLRLDKLLTPELFFLSDQERGLYGFVITFEASLKLTGIKEEDTVEEQTWLLSKRVNDLFIFDPFTPYIDQSSKLAFPVDFIYEMIERAVEWYPESFSYEEFSKACVICASEFIKVEQEKEKQNKPKFEFEKEYYLEKYGHADDQEKALFLKAKKEYKNFSHPHGSPTAEVILENLVELNPNFASAHFFLAVVRVQNWETKKIHLELFEKLSKFELRRREEEVIHKSSVNFTKAISLNPYYEEDMLEMQRKGLI